MILIIDGYNVLKGVHACAHVPHPQREEFIVQLGMYARRKKHYIIVVFDGGPYDWPDKEKRNGVVVVYAGAQRSADDYIKELLRKYRGYDAILISSDRELNRRATSNQILSIKSHDFYNSLQDALEQERVRVVTEYEEKSVKLIKNDNPEVDRLMMEEHWRVPAKNSMVDKSLRISTGQQLSKEDRRRAKKLRKL